MSSFNRVILMGNLTRDVEVRYAQSGTAIGNVSLAVNRHWVQDGQKKEEVTFVEIAFFNKSAETIAQYCKKGSALLIEGRLKLDMWEDKQTGQKRSKLMVIGESFQFVGSGPKSESKSESRPMPQRETTGELPVEDDVPF